MRNANQPEFINNCQSGAEISPKLARAKIWKCASSVVAQFLITGYGHLVSGSAESGYVRPARCVFRFLSGVPRPEVVLVSGEASMRAVLKAAQTAGTRSQWIGN